MSCFISYLLWFYDMWLRLSAPYRVLLLTCFGFTTYDLGFSAPCRVLLLTRFGFTTCGSDFPLYVVFHLLLALDLRHVAQAIRPMSCFASYLLWIYDIWPLAFLPHVVFCPLLASGIRHTVPPFLCMSYTQPVKRIEWHRPSPRTICRIKK